VHRIRLEREAEVVVVSADGDLDAFAAPALDDAFEEVTAADRIRLLIDLSRVPFIDSTALGLIVRRVNEVADKGGHARVVLPETTARRIFEITTLDRVLPISPSKTAAVLELSSRAHEAALGD
jgi:anti-sigma B factor antagonist